jgi:5-methylthioadenosine/S-adenosylhomocysteine deaminase
MTSSIGHSGKGRVLFRNAYLLTQDRALGSFRGDLLVEEDAIAAVGHNLPTSDAEIVDGSEYAVMPGFVDTHRHTWQTALRGLATGATLQEYQHLIQGQLGRLFTPQDVYAGNLLGALAAAQSGITTLCDESHVQNSPAHTDAAVKALRDSGVRAVFDYGWPSVDAPKWMQNSSLTHPTYVRELQQREFQGADELVTLRMMLRGPLMTPIEITRKDLAFARDLGLRSAMHVIGGNIKELAVHGLLGNDLMFIHCCDSSDEELRLTAQAGASVSSAPNLELNMAGFGAFPPMRRFLEAGLRPSLSIDVETAVAGDMFSVMRAALMLETVQSITATQSGNAGQRVTVADVLEFATINGAMGCGLDARFGSLSPKKKADLILIRLSDANLAPIDDATAARQIVSSAHPGNVSDVMVGGRFLRRDGRPTNSAQIEEAVSRASHSRLRLLKQAGIF